jgi:hypothetical protein
MRTSVRLVGAIMSTALAGVLHGTVAAEEVAGCTSGCACQDDDDPVRFGYRAWNCNFTGSESFAAAWNCLIGCGSHGASTKGDSDEFWCYCGPGAYGCLTKCN